MFPKRMKGREAPHRPALDSTKLRIGSSPAGTTQASIPFPPGPGPSQTQAHICDLSPRDVSGAWEKARGPTSLSLNTKPRDKRQSREGRKLINKTKKRNPISENIDVLFSAHFFMCRWTGRLFCNIIQVGKNIPHLGFLIGSKELLNFSSLSSQITDPPRGNVRMLLNLSLQPYRACGLDLGFYRHTQEYKQELFWAPTSGA